MLSTASRLPKHQRVAKTIRQQVRTNHYRPGEILPPIRALAEQLGVSSNAVHRALRVLQHEGLVETMPGQGVRVLTLNQPGSAPLTFGFVEPYSPAAAFYGDIQAFLATAMEKRNDYVIPRSSNDDPMRERQVIDRLVDSGVQGLVVWPVAGDDNRDYFQELAEHIPLVFVDRVIPGVKAPSVVLDWQNLGKRIITDLRQIDVRHALILDDPLAISSYRDLYRGMRQAAANARGYHFHPVHTTDFSMAYVASPAKAVETHAAELEQLLSGGPYEAIFSPQDAYLDAVYAATELADRYPIGNVITITHPRPALRSLEFYRLSPVRWVNPLDRVLSKAIDLLDEAVHLRQRRSRPHHLDFEKTQSTLEAAWTYRGLKDSSSDNVAANL